MSRYETPLHSAAWYSNAEIVKILVSNEANVNAKRIDGETPLDRVRGSNEIHQFLVSKGAVGGKD